MKKSALKSKPQIQITPVKMIEASKGVCHNPCN